ncbi:AraC family transcriptional regulator [Acidocella sp. KAb 2-4]|uniref:AraC family transcriptional regulator n=1 Tax=Acidocella sp. KAb 2-4 TaxID=2885158 RepID=UPI001D094FF6|nr:AraC family transcriptional regulator [Acidocella sp. KAb 2-4]MCB5944700.1 AraC family transcriptional regulator [Acidocella sp. KAb 2-4]
MSETNAERRMIRPSFVEEALDCLRRKGLPVAPVLAAAGLAEPLAGPVSAEVYGRMWLALAAAMQDEYFGLGGRPMRPGGFVLLCRAVLHSATLEQALRRALRFLAVLLDDPRGELRMADGLAEVVLHDAGVARSAFAYRTFWIILHGLACWLAGRRIPLRLVDFRCAEPPGVADYRLFFGAPVRFSRPHSRIAFDASYLALPVRRDEAALKVFLRAAPANLLVRYRYDAGAIAGIRARLRELPPTAWPDFAATARLMRLSPSTLRHRLRQEGQSWSGLRDEIRRDLAIAALTGSRRGVAEIAAELGFAEPSAFHRAFRKWTSKSPGAFRREMSALGPGQFAP